jgi:hypothetical protein
LSLPGKVVSGRVYVIKNVDVTKFIVLADSVAGSMIDDQSSVIVRQKHALTLISDGAGVWQVIGTVV